MDIIMLLLQDYQILTRLYNIELKLCDLKISHFNNVVPVYNKSATRFSSF